MSTGVWSSLDFTFHLMIKLERLFSVDLIKNGIQQTHKDKEVD